jgi:uncharacterized protein YbjT (DUF2867 family)
VAEEGKSAMKIVAMGGTGLVGSKVVALLRQHGHQIVAASPRRGVNTLTGDGLSDVLADAQIVVDLTNAPSNVPDVAAEFFSTSTRNVLAAATAAGVRHYVVLSIVGADRVSGQGYFRAKVAQEKLIEASGVPYTIVRSTQFFEFIGRIIEASTKEDVVRLAPGLFQPIAADDVAAAIADVALSNPQNGIKEIAGPERAPFNIIVNRFLKAIGDTRKVVTDSEARYFGGTLEKMSLVPLGRAQLGSLSLDEWLFRSEACV